MERVQIITPDLTLGYLDDIKRTSIDHWKKRRLIPEQIHLIQSNFNKILEALPDDLTEGRKGCVISITKRNRDFPTPPLLLLAGIVDAKDKDFGTKQDKYAAYALSKTAFLIMHPEYDASRFNLDLPHDKQLNIAGVPVPGGAIVLPHNDVISISGYPTGEIDEAIAMLFAYTECYTSISTLDSLADKIGNTTWRRAKNAYLAA